MTRKMLCLCAVVALLLAVSMASVASAQETAPAAPCPCGNVGSAAPCAWGCPAAPWLGNGCQPIVTYRVGLFGAIRPVIYAPVYRSVSPWYTCPPPYAAPYRPVYAPYCGW